MSKVDVFSPVITVDGQAYHLVAEKSADDPCQGCAFVDRVDQFNTCKLGKETIPTSIYSACTKEGEVWVPIAMPNNATKNGYTVREVIDAAIELALINDHYVDAVEKQITDLLVKQRDPEYKEYLRLRAKFD